MSITSRIDAITRIPPEYRSEVLPAPKSVKIELTANCNYKCGFCIKSLRADNGEMQRSLYTRVIKELRNAGVEELGVFFIGESFTCRWLPDAIKEAKDIGFPYVFLTTNGSAATPERIKDVFDAGLDSLKFSMNYADEAQFKSIANVSSKFFRKAIDNLKKARAIRDAGDYQCKIYASSIAFDGKQGEMMQDVINEITPFVDEHYLLPLFNMGGAGKVIGRPTQGNPGRLGNMREPLPCWSAFTEGHVTHDGKLVACCFGVGLDDSLIMGDLQKESFMSAWNSERFQFLRKAHLAKNVSGTGCEMCIASN